MLAHSVVRGGRIAHLNGGGDPMVLGKAGMRLGRPLGLANDTGPGDGAPDGVALIDLGTGELLDALSYEGSIVAAQIDGLPGTYDLVEGAPATVQDSNSTDGALARFPDGADTDDASADWYFAPVPTPGAANPAP